MINVWKASEMDFILLVQDSIDFGYFRNPEGS